MQATGHLGFSDGARKKLRLENGKYLVLAVYEEDEKDENLYGWIEDTGENSGFKINKAGLYYNVNTKPLFDKLQVDYRDKKNLIIFDIADIDYEGNKIYKLVKRVQKRTNKIKKTDETDN